MSDYTDEYLSAIAHWSMEIDSRLIEIREEQHVANLIAALRSLALSDEEVAAVHAELRSRLEIEALVEIHRDV